MPTTSSSTATETSPSVIRDSRPVPESLTGSVVTIGNFDGLHLGHQALIATARELADRGGKPCTILTFTPHPRRFLAPDERHFELTGESAKLRILAALAVDGVFLRRFDAAMAAMSASDFMAQLLARELQASGLVVGANFHFGRSREGSPAVLSNLARAAGLDCVLVPSVDRAGAPVSSSRIRKALIEGDVVAANGMLGYRWFVTGEVRHGDKRGRDLGFPTANMALPEECGLRHGIYAVRMAIAPGRVVDGVASFGRRPTFDNGAPLLETHLIDFAGDLYGRVADVELVGWIRPEERFDSADALVARMEDDRLQARAMLAGEAARPTPRSFIA